MEEKETKLDNSENAGETKHSRIREFMEYAGVILFGVLLALFISRCVIINAEIPSESMVSLLNEGDRLLGLRPAYLLGEPKRGDVIMFYYPVDESRIFIKRVIGLPGETVEIKDAKIYIDESDTPLEETYLPEEWVVGNDGYEFHVPEGCYFVLGDNRNVSEDARYWADNALDAGVADTEEEADDYTYVKKKKIVGKAMLKYRPKLQWLNGRVYD